MGGEIRQTLHIGIDLAPVGIVEKCFDLVAVLFLIPGPAVGLGILDKVAILQKQISLIATAVEICVQIRLNSAFGRVDLKASQDRQSFCLLPTVLPFFRIRVFIIGDDASIERRVADLADT